MKKKLIFPIIGVLGILVVLIGCAPQYLTQNFDSKTMQHREVAIVPVEMIFLGVVPDDWTEEDVIEIEEAESRAFQISFYREVLRSTRSGKRPIRVELQHHQKTLQMLEEAGVDIRTSWQLSAEELARILQVDAVVKSSIQKTQFMSDLESFGIDVATHVIGMMTNYRLWPFIPFSPRSKEVQADYTLLNGIDGITLWSISFEESADWRQPANEIIDNISHRAARHFPYRIK